MGFKEVKEALLIRMLAVASDDERRRYATAQMLAGSVNYTLLSEESLTLFARQGKVAVSLTGMKKGVPAEDWGGVLSYLLTHFEEWPGFGFSNDPNGNPQLEFSQHYNVI